MGTLGNSVLLLPAAAGLAIFALHCLVEWVLHLYLFFLVSEFTEGVLIAVIAAALLAHVQAVRRRRLLSYKRRMEAVATLNHHVRNALEIIVAHAAGEVRVPAEHVKNAIRRIDCVLRDVEPQLRQNQESA